MHVYTAARERSFIGRGVNTCSSFSPVEPDDNTPLQREGLTFIQAASRTESLRCFAHSEALDQLHIHEIITERMPFDDLLRKCLLAKTRLG